MSGSSVSDAEAALQERCARLTKLKDQPHRVIIHGIVVVAFDSAVILLAGVFLRTFQEAVNILCLALRLPELHDLGDLLLGDEGSVYALYPAGSRWQIQHVAAAE